MTNKNTRPTTLIKKENSILDFLKLESTGGILLMIAAVFAIILANTPLIIYYNYLIDLPVEIQIGSFEIAKPLLLWINDGLMALFFLLVGLELKRELIEGELSQFHNISLPALGALGGMIVPATIYVAINHNDPVAIKGWAIPTATDIAFALGILALLGNRVPVSVKIFLTSLAIFDDIAAILIIALFYTNNISFISLVIAAVCLSILFCLNKKGIAERSPYFLVGIVMWVALLKSGVHATLAGVLLAMFIPLKNVKDPDDSPLRELEHDLHTVVAIGVLPLFAFVNSGIKFTGMGLDYILHDVPLGIICGLFIGKPLGIFFFCLVGIKLGMTKLPSGMSWLTLYGIAALCGVGFTMSLFIGSLAFEETGVNLLFDNRLGILIGSILSGILGYVILNKSLRNSTS